MKKELIFFASLMALVLTAPAHAASFAIDISDITIMPQTIYGGDEITVAVKFSAGAPESSLSSVKLSLFFDDSLIDSKISTYSSGTYTYTFRYKTDAEKTSTRKITVSAKVYDAGTLSDEDSITKSIYINPKTGAHDLRIIAVSAPESVDAGAEFPVTVSIKNRGDAREDNIQIAVLFDKKISYAKPASIAAGETVDRTITLRAPESAGKYDIEMQVTNAYNLETEKTSLTVKSLFLSLTISKSAATVNEWVGVSGYATRGGIIRAGNVNIYRDGIFIGQVPTTENGYYSTQIRFDSSGTHKVTAIAGDIRKDAYVYITGPGAGGAPAQPAPQQEIVPQNYTTIIIVTPDGEKTIYPESLYPRGKYEGFSYADVEISSKQLDVVQYSGNTLTVTVTNHLGRSGLFRVETDFNESWVFLPRQEVLLDGETRRFDIYFNPDQAGQFHGNIFVFDGANILKKAPLELFVSMQPEFGATEKRESPAITAWAAQVQAGGLAALFIATIFLMYLALKKPRALEPLGFQPLAESKGLTQKSAEPHSAQPEKFAIRQPQKAAGPGFFQVPRRNIIM